MLHPIIREYVLSKVEKKSKDNASFSSEDECKSWILNVAKNYANQRKTSTHVPKFIHPSTDIGFTNLIILPNPEEDGYIRTGNVPEYLDSFGNAAAISASELMFLEIDEKPLFKHLQQKTDIGKEFAASFENEEFPVVDSFLEMMKTTTSATDSRTRQVFFPVGNDEYHIITPLMSSPVMNRLSTILDRNKKYISNPIDVKDKKPIKAKDFEDKKMYLEGGYWTLYDTVDIKFGGSKPLNISTLNNKAKGFKLLKSVPPQIRRRKIRIPVTSFFTDSVYVKADRYSDVFTALDRIFKTAKNNLNIKDKRDRYFDSLLEEIATDIAAVRNEISLFEGEYKGSLDSAEYMMLYEDEKRFENEEWLGEISDKFARWFFNSYKKIITSSEKFDDAQYRFVRNYAYKNKEVFIQ